MLPPSRPPGEAPRRRAGPRLGAGARRLLGSLGLALLCLGGPAPEAGAEEFIYLGAGPILGDRARQLRQGGAAPAGWTSPDFDDSAWPLPRDAAPGAVPDGGAPPPCTGTLYLRRRFDAGPERDRLASLALRLRYEDGFAAYLNGTEVARRRLPDAAQTDGSTLASDRSSSEAETHYIALKRGDLRPQDNLLAIEVHPRAAERCARLDAELSAADGPRLVRGPYIEQLSDSAVDITVESDVPTQLEVRYGKGPTRAERDRRVADSAPGTVHRLHLSGLRPGAVYHYQIALRLPSGAQTDLPEASFHTPPRAGRPLSFIVYGDSRSGHAIHAQVVEAVLREDPDLVLHTGDAVERGTEEGDWDRFFQVAAPLLSKYPLYMVPGNHEYARRQKGAARLFELFATMFQPQVARPEGREARDGKDGPGGPQGRDAQSATREARALLGDAAPAPPPEPPAPERGYYSFDAAGVHFVGLDSNQYRSPRQLRWLEDDLQAARERRARAIFVWAHDGPYSSGWHGDNEGAIKSYVPVLERHGVTMFFSGHDHDFERGVRGRLPYVVTGGAGAELRPLKCGAPGKKKCKHPPQSFINDHNYVRIEVQPGMLQLCPKKIDGTPLEPCQQLKLPR